MHNFQLSDFVKPVYADGPAEDYVDLQSNVDGVADVGTHSNFTAQMYGPDSTYDTLTEANTGGGVTIEDYVDQISNVDSVPDLGTHSAFANIQASDSSYDLLSEQDVSSGAYWWFNRTDTQQSGTNTAYDSAPKHTLSFTAPALGDYLIMSNAGISGSSTTTGVRVRTQLDNSVTISEAEVQVGSTSPQGFKPFANIYLAQSLSAGSHYVDMDVYKVTSGTWYMDYAHITVLRLDDWMPTANMYAYTETTTASNIGTGVANAFQTQATLTFTPDSAGNYIVIAMVQLRPASTTASALTRLNFDSGTRYIPLSNTEESATNPLVFEGRTVTDQNSWVWGSIVDLTAASHTFLLETGMSSTATGANGAANKRILAMRIAAMDSSAHTIDDTSVTSTTAQYTQKASIQFTPSATKDFLIFGGLSNKPDSSAYPTGTRLIQNAGDEVSTIGLVQHDSKDSSTPADCFPFFASSVRSWTPQTQNVSVDYGYGMGTSGTAYGKGAFIVIIEKPSGATADYQLDMEVQFTEAIDFLSVEKVCIQTGTFSGSEDINVTYWTGSTWSSITSDLTASTWNNYTVSITSTTFTIKFGGSTTSSDMVQDTWNIDAVLLQLSGAGSNEYIVDNEDSNVDNIPDNGTLTNFANMQDYPSNYATLQETATLGEITFVDSTESSNTASASMILSKPTGVVEGDFMFAYVGSTLASDTDGDLMSAYPSGWTEEYNYINTATSGQHAYIYWKIAGASEPSTYGWTWTTATTGWVGIISAWRGVNQTTPIHIEGTLEAQTTSGTVVCPSITPTEDNCLILAMEVCDAAVTNVPDLSPPSGFTYDTAIEISTPGNGIGIEIVYQVQTTAVSTGDTTITLSGSDEHRGMQYAILAAISSDEYILNQEVQFVDLLPDLPIEMLCIATGTLDAEDILVDVWDGDSWENVFTDLAASTWNNVSITTYLTSSTLTIQFRDGTRTNDTTTQDSWQIDVAIIHVQNVGVNYELELEEQFTNCEYSRTNEELCILMEITDSETLSVQWWNSTDSTWLTILSSLTASQWNNISVTTYLTSETFTIRFIDSLKSNDATQSTWQKDCALLHTWNLGYNLNLRVRDWDLTDSISGALVYKDTDVLTSNGGGWTNWTLVTGTVAVKVKYFGFWVNGTFQVEMTEDKTIDVRCRLYDVTVTVQENVQSAYLVGANVTVFNGTSTYGNRIKTGITGNNGQVTLTNLPNNTLTFTEYGKSDWSLVIGNATQLVNTENQSITLTSNQNNLSIQDYHGLIGIVVGIIIPLKRHSIKKCLKRKKQIDRGEKNGKNKSKKEENTHWQTFNSLTYGTCINVDN